MLAVRDDRSKAKRGPVRGVERERAHAGPYRLRLHNPVTLPVDYAGKLWCEQRQEAQ
jgi:hypothetical protein